MGNRICRKDCLKGQHASSLINQKYISSKFKQKKQEPVSNKASTLNQSIAYTVERPIQQKINHQQPGQDQNAQVSFLNIPTSKRGLESTAIMLENKLSSEELPIQSKISCDESSQIQLSSQKFVRVPVQQILGLKIIKHILKYPELQNNFQYKSQTISHHLYFGWRRIKTNLYVNYIPGGKVYILRQDKLYKGWVKTNSLLPQSSGKLITIEGCYQGCFLDGKAHGRGSYQSNLFLYEGDWKNGELFKGKIFFRGLMIYEGYLKHGLPEGYGSMRILNSRIIDNRRKYKQSTYYGQFQKGKFHGKGIYKCSEYSYEGGFYNGKKNGMGILQLNKNNHVNYNFSEIKEIYKGQFENDFFISRLHL